MTIYALRPHEIARLCDGTQHAKNGWTSERRAEVVVDGETCHEDMSQAEPFNLWASVGPHREVPSRWTCEECGETGTLFASEMLGWSNAASLHQMGHASGPFGVLPVLRISEEAG